MSAVGRWWWSLVWTDGGAADSAHIPTRRISITIREAAASAAPQSGGSLRTRPLIMCDIHNHTHHLRYGCLFTLLRSSGVSKQGIPNRDRRGFYLLSFNSSNKYLVRVLQIGR